MVENMIKAKDIKTGMRMNLPYYGHLLPSTVIEVKITSNTVYVEYLVDQIEDSITEDRCGCCLDKNSEYEEVT